MLIAQRTKQFPNLETPDGDMNYEVERLISFLNVKMILTASQLSHNGFYYNQQSKKITCFFCKIEHDVKVCNLTHGPSCALKQKNIPVHMDEASETDSSCFRNTPVAADSIRHSPSPPVTITREADMKIEADRLKTFTKWDEKVPVRPADLAHNGFYFKGFADVVVCAFCRLELRNWEQGDNVYTEHQRHNPNCPFLASVLELPDAVPTPTLNMKYEQNRQKTFSSVADSFAVDTKALVQNGFYFIGPRDKVRCDTCKCELSNWKREDNIKQRHQNQSPNCPLVQNSTPYPTNVIFDRPKHPQFALLNDRLKTFINWPAEKKQTPQLLAEAGFYHTGETDTVICYCCDGGLCNWDEEDDPWIEHARWYPRCTYVRQRKGDQFVTSVKKDEFPYASDASIAGSHLNGEDTVEANPPPSRPQGPPPTPGAQAKEPDVIPPIAEPFRKSPTVLAVLGLGYDENLVEYIVKKKIKETGSAFAKASLLLEAVVKHIEEFGSEVTKDQQEEVEHHDVLAIPEKHPNLDNKLREENRLLKEQKTCKICLDDDLSIVFLPCGHFVSCATCAPSLKTCPLCRSQILGLVRAYMS